MLKMDTSEVILIPRRELAEFSTWLLHEQRKPLILRGARQVGKSTLVRMGAQQAGRVLWEINLERHNNLGPLFATRDPARILRELPLLVRLPPAGDSMPILFLDEIQEIPEALVCLRYFHEELPAQPVVAAGSLLEFTLSSADFSMPVGRVQYLWIGPLNFTDFLRGMGEDGLINLILSWEPGQEILEPVHQKLLLALREYFIVGGMPEAVQVYAQTRQFDRVAEVHHSILQTYKDDFGKYARGAALERIRHVFESIPLTIGQKIKYRAYHPDWKAADIREALELLERAGLLIKVVHSDASGLPLDAGEDQTVFKLFFLDIGLVLSSWDMNGLNPRYFLEGKFLQEGKLAEQYAAQALVAASGVTVQANLHYWLREGKSTNAEVDFILARGNRILPLEIKAGTSGSLRSLHQFIAIKNVPEAWRSDILPPSIQMINTEIMQADGKKRVSYTLSNIPLYLLPWGIRVT